MEEVMIYGAGAMGRAMCSLLQEKCRVRCFLDRNEELWHADIFGKYPVRNPFDADIDRNCKVIVSMVADTFQNVKSSLEMTGGGYRDIVAAGAFIRKLYQDAEGYFTNLWELQSVIQPDAYLSLFQDGRSKKDWKMAYEWFAYGAEDCYRVEDRKRYFPDFLKTEIDRCTAMLDTAALHGEYIDMFLRGKAYRKVYALQLHPASMDEGALVHKYAQAGNVKFFTYEAGERNTVVSERRAGLMEPFAVLQEVSCPMKKIDDMGLPFFDYLRCYSMSRTEAVLKGAETSIRKYRPLIAVNIGHYESDFINVPLLLKSFCINYKFYFRVHSYQGNDCLMYAVPKDL